MPAALDAVKQWVYQTTLLNGNPVEVVTQIDVNFTLVQWDGKRRGRPGQAGRPVPLGPERSIISSETEEIRVWRESSPY